MPNDRHRGGVRESNSEIRQQAAARKPAALVCILDEPGSGAAAAMATSPTLPPDDDSVPHPEPRLDLPKIAQASGPSPDRNRGWILGLFGPSLISGAANDDPCAIGTSAQAGAAFGFSFLWTAPFTFPMMATTVFLCSKLGLVTGMGIAGVVKRHHSHWLLYPLVAAVLVANIFEAGADIGAIAAALGLLLHVPVTGITVGVTVIIVVIQTWGSYELLLRIFKWLTVALFAYVGAAILARPDPAQVLAATFRPTLRFNADYLAMLIALLGTRISPYMYFWQASQEVEHKTAGGRLRVITRGEISHQELRHAVWDVNVGMFFSNLIVYFIILCAAATLSQSGIRHVDTAYAAAQALRPLAGRAASLLFATGVIGVGILAVPVLTSASAYALAETFGWKHGLDRRPDKAPEFYAVIALSTCVALAIGFSGINPLHALFWAAVMMGLLAPPLLCLIMLVTNSRKIMGARVNGFWMNLIGWATTMAATAAAAGLIWSWVR